MFRKKYSERWEDEKQKKKRFTHRYNTIPEGILKEPILEVGPGEGLRQVECKYKDIFLTSDYLGIDLLKPKSPELNIIQGDILEFESDKKFQTILMIGVLEHISLDQWPSVIKKLKSLCLIGGSVVIYVPFQESINRYMIHEGDHLVYGITKEFMQFFFPEANIKVIYDQMLKQQDETYFWAVGRWFKRLLTLNKMIFKIIPRRVGLLVIWKKL